MHIKIRRRRFGQLVISGMAASAIANLPRRVNAQSASVLYGVEIQITSQKTPIGINNTDAIGIDANNTDGISKDFGNPDTIGVSAGNKTPSLVIIATDVATGKEVSRVAIPSSQVENVDAKPEVGNKPIFSRPTERITQFTALSDGTLAVISVLSTKEGNVSRVSQIDPKSGKSIKAVKVSGFKNRNSTLESLVATKDNSFVAIVSQYDALPPFETAGFELKTGTVIAGEKLALPVFVPNRRYSNLTLAPDGIIYGTTVSSEGAVALIKIDLNDKAVLTGKAKVSTVIQLKLEKEELQNDLLSLAINSSGQIYALANPTTKGDNLLYRLDQKTGQLSFLRNFPVKKIAFART
jgi:hypothetical protein